MDALFSAVLFLLLTLQPAVINDCVGTLSKRSVGEITYVETDLSVVYDSPEFDYYTAKISLPILLSWLIIPILLLIFSIYKSRNK